MLSPHVLIFTREGVGWQCQSKNQCDPELQASPVLDLTIRLPAQIFLDKITPQETATEPNEIYKSWISVVNEYSKGLLSVESDKFHAIAGIAERYGQKLGEQLGYYFAGLWSNWWLRVFYRYRSVRKSSSNVQRTSERPRGPGRLLMELDM